MSNFLPNSLIQRLGVNPTFDKDAFIAAHEDGNQITSIRLNPFKPTELDFYLSEQVQWCDNGYYLANRPQFTLDPLFHAGAYYVQEASSMFIAHIIQTLGLNKEALFAADVCAAPGGKSTLLNSYLHPDSLLLSNEIIKSRSIILQENLTRWGASNVVVSNNDPSAFRRLPGFFDLLLVDAPCSGSGMFRKDEDAIDEWSEANVKLCSERQQRILSEVLTAVKTNGYLIYSTCSYSEEENEDILDWLMDEFEMETVDVELKEEWGIVKSNSPKHQATGFRFYPHRVKGEGFFVAVLRMKQVQPSFSLKKLKVEKSPLPKDALKGWVKDYAGFATLVHHDTIHIFAKEHELAIKAFQQVLYLKNAGTAVGKWLGKELVPNHDLAMSIHLDEAINSIDLTLDLAQDYLRKEAMPQELFEGVKKGWCIVKYKNLPIGWIKVLGNRVNNYYPKEVRIANL
ncbi:methyltransferase RsmF C-terminal domain-like protein [Sphingobacterium hotanense]|uniref:RNA methyltransferase n=1 Tax=Sphingobacterium hotanense TaxID=649196 RepID=A0ABT7NKX8_9SPHI|nr:RNA methyltransferase [Sphingobacterium hotanense]MDM1047884.1 RNA methyltransferase [Sphingobacterium hotanense]